MVGPYVEPELHLLRELGGSNTPTTTMTTTSTCSVGSWFRILLSLQQRNQDAFPSGISKVQSGPPCCARERERFHRKKANQINTDSHRL